MSKLAALSLIAILVSPLALLAGQKKSAPAGLTVAGTTEGNTGCMILQKHMPVKRKLLFAGMIYARTEYRVVESFNYKPTSQKFTGQGQINELNRNAVKNKVKLVIVPSRYTEEQMKEARKLCRK